jgi:hypothetical protein
MRSAHDFGVGLAMTGRQPRPRAQRLRGAEASHVTGLGDEDGRDGAAHAGEGLDRLIPGVVAQLLVDETPEHRHLAVVTLDQIAKRLDAVRVRRLELERIELDVAAGPEHVEYPRQHALFGHHRVYLCLQARAQRDHLGSIAHQLPQLPRRRRRDPRLRQPTQPQQIRQVPGVALVVLDPPVAPVVARRMREMHPVAIRLEQVHRPVPAIGRLDHHLGVRAGRRRPPTTTPPDRWRSAHTTPSRPRPSSCRSPHIWARRLSSQMGRAHVGKRRPSPRPMTLSLDGDPARLIASTRRVPPPRSRRWSRRGRRRGARRRRARGRRARRRARRRRSLWCFGLGRRRWLWRRRRGRRFVRDRPSFCRARRRRRDGGGGGRRRRSRRRCRRHGLRIWRRRPVSESEHGGHGRKADEQGCHARKRKQDGAAAEPRKE